jgi:hypothetical protein
MGRRSIAAGDSSGGYAERQQPVLKAVITVNVDRMLDADLAKELHGSRRQEAADLAKSPSDRLV